MLRIELRKFIECDLSGKSMKILYDHQIFSLQEYGGISRYFCELYSHLLMIDTIHPEISVVYSDNNYYQKLLHQKRYLPDQKFLGKYLNLGKHIIINKINEYNSKKRIINGNYDIFHPTYYNPYFLKYIRTQPYVLTIYDMIHELFPDMFNGDITAIQKKEVIEGATKLIAISNNTKADIIKYYGIDPKKIEVISLATSLQINTPDIIPNMPQKYILFVGNRGAYKNFTFFINSISSFLLEEKDLCLVCAGGGFFLDNELQLFDDLKIKKKVLYYPIHDDSTLSYFYR